MQQHEPKASRSYFAVQDPGPDADFRTGMGADGRQVLIGMLYPGLVAVFFDERGKLVHVEERVLEEPTLRAFRAGQISKVELRGHYDSALLRWQREIGLTERPISINEFYLHDRAIGIEPVPKHLRDAVAAAARGDRSEDTRELAEQADEWARNEMYVLWWGKDYWMTKDGEIEST